MRLHRFITEFQRQGNELIISDPKTIHQIVKVFRMRTGDRLIICDNAYTDYVCQITDRDGQSLTVVLENSNSLPIDTRDIIIALAMIKKESFEYALEKMTEVGVTKIIPIITKRTVKTGFRRERCEDILREATEQSGRGKVPELSDPIDLETVLEQPHNGTMMTADFSDTRIGDVMNIKDHARMIYIGPEGGWDDRERELFKQHGVVAVSLGNTVLRAETAAVVAGWCTKNL